MDKEYYTVMLKQGKQIRVKYDGKNDDGCYESGWWLEELWVYDHNSNLFRCYYPVSSYEKEYYTTHTEKETISAMEDAIWNSQNKDGYAMVTDIIVEELGCEISSLSVREQMMKEISCMSDEELSRMLRIQN